MFFPCFLHTLVIYRWFVSITIEHVLFFAIVTLWDNLSRND